MDFNIKLNMNNFKLRELKINNCLLLDVSVTDKKNDHKLRKTI